MASNPKYPYADWRELHGAKKEALESVLSGTADILKGTAKEYAAPFANTAGTLLVGAGRSEKSVALPEWSSSGKYKGVDRQALHEAQIQAAKDYGQAMQSAADRWKQSGEEDIARATQGLSSIERGIVDAGVQGLTMLGDKTLGTVTKTGALPYLAIRTFGNAAQTARQEGASTGKQLAYGAGSAISGAAIEKAVNGIAGLYGKGGINDKIRRAVDAVAEERGWSELQRARFNNTLTALGESIEKGATDIVGEFMKSGYNDKNPWQNVKEADKGKMIEDALIDFIIAFALKER